MTFIEVDALTKRYGDHAVVDGVTFAVDAGEIFCLLGPNGAGKTTTINLLLGFTAPTSGSARIKGHDVTAEQSAAKRHVAYIPEQVSLYRNLTGLENLRFFSRLAGHRGDVDEDFVRCLADVGLPRDVADRRVRVYSKGMRQKVGLAIAMARHADVLLLDEPTSGLDPTAANEFATLLARLRDRGAAVLMTTHDLFRAKASGTRIGIMRAGRLLTTMRTADIAHEDLETVYLAHTTASARTFDSG